MKIHQILIYNIFFNTFFIPFKLYANFDIFSKKRFTTSELQRHKYHIFLYIYFLAWYWPKGNKYVTDPKNIQTQDKHLWTHTPRMGKHTKCFPMQGLNPQHTHRSRKLRGETPWLTVQSHRDISINLINRKYFKCVFDANP